MPIKEATTVAPLAVPGEGGVLVWLRAADGSDLSNRVPLDDRRRRSSWLEQRKEGGDRPRELDSSDFETPVGQMLLRLHEACIFDIDETPALARAAGLTEQEAEEQKTSWEELEELLAKEELARDPRFPNYPRDTGFGLLEDDDVLALLRLMLDRAPAERTLRLVGGKPDEPPTETGTPWTPTNGSAFACSTSCSAGHWHSPTRASSGSRATSPRTAFLRLVGTLLGSFIRTDRSRGYLISLSEDERQSALSRLKPWPKPAPSARRLSTVRCDRPPSGRTTCSVAASARCLVSSSASST